MAVLGKAGFHGSATHATRVLRNDVLSVLLGQPVASHANSATATTRGGSYGVAGGGDMLVTITSGLGWSCAAGRVAGPGTFATAQGAYGGVNDAALTGTLNARDASNPRITYIAWRVRDTDEDATGAEDDGIVMIDGTAAASPSPPSVPSSLGTLVILSEVLVPSTANGGAPTYTDRRTYLTAIGGIQRCNSTTRPTGVALWEGVSIDEMDTDRRWRYSGAAWQPMKGRFGAECSRGAYAIASGVTDLIPLDTETYDTDGYHTAVAATIVIPTGLAGFYEFSAYVAGSAGVSALSRADILLNGGIVASCPIPVGATTITLTRGFAAAVGDAISIQVANNHSASLNWQGILSAIRVSD